MQQITVNIKIVIFGVIDNSLAVFINEGLLPSTEVQSQKTLDEQVDTLFTTATGFPLGNNYSEQLYTVAAEDNTISIVYYVLVPLSQNQKYDDAWKKVKSTAIQAQDKTIISYAVQRLEWKIEYTNVVYSLLPKEFTLSDLQKTYEAILGQILDKRNFRKKILSLDFLEPTGKRRVGVSRPAQVYTFKKRSPTLVKIFS